MNKKQTEKVIEEIEKISFRVYCGAFSKTVAETSEIIKILRGVENEIE